MSRKLEAKSARPLQTACAWLVGLVLASMWASPASACPSCEVGRQARSEVWANGFGVNLAGALLPFLVIGFICVRVEAIGRQSRKRI